MAEVTVQVLDDEEWQTYRQIRLASLKSDPEAFASSLDEEQQYDEAFWRARLQRGKRLLALSDEEEAGVASVGPAPDEEEPQEGVGELFGMWVRPEFRGSGVAWQLVNAAADQARQDGNRALRLWVATDNGRAVGFYSSYGFRPTDDRRAMASDSSTEEIAMILPL